VAARSRDPEERGEWVVPFLKPKSLIGDARHFRSTWLTASQVTLRERGLGERYEAALAPEFRAQILGAVPGVWLPMEVARAHYTACDTLGLSTDVMVEIGKNATLRANATSLAFISRMAKTVGVTPWTVLAQTPRLWAATCDDGAVGVQRLGPKEARVEIVGYPLAGLTYNRVTMRGIVLGVVSHFCSQAYAKEIPQLCTARTVGLRLSWA
jgi:hypothetical protein